jgi:hypothetical protein
MKLLAISLTQINEIRLTKITSKGGVREKAGMRLALLPMAAAGKPHLRDPTIKYFGTTLP